MCSWRGCVPINLMWCIVIKYLWELCPPSVHSAEKHVKWNLHVTNTTVLSPCHEWTDIYMQYACHRSLWFLEAFCIGSLLEMGLYTSNLGDSRCYSLSCSRSFFLCLRYFFSSSSWFCLSPWKHRFLGVCIRAFVIFQLLFKNDCSVSDLPVADANWQLLLKIFTECYRKLINKVEHNSFATHHTRMHV